MDQGQTGQLLVNIKGRPQARSYELRYGAQETGGLPGSWTATVVSNIKQPTAINNLTPGVIYSFQVRAFNRLGGSDWSESAGRMCI